VVVVFLNVVYGGRDLTEEMVVGCRGAAYHIGGVALATWKKNP